MKNLYSLLLAITISVSGIAQDYTTINGSVTTGSSSVVCLAGSFSSPSAVNTASFTDKSNFSLLAGLGCSYWLESTLNGTVPAGHYAGFHINSSNILNLLSGITVHTYLGGIWRESASGGSLLNVLLAGEGDVYFQTTMSYDRVRIEFSGLLSVAYSLDIYYGYGLATPPTGRLLPVFIRNVSVSSQDNKNFVRWTLQSNNEVKNSVVERSANGVDFKEMTTVAATGENAASYLYTDNNPLDGNNYYRVKIKSRSSVTYYSNVLVASNITTGKEQLVVANQGGTLQLRLTAFKPGNYRMQLLNGNGAPVSTQQVYLYGSTDMVNMNKPSGNGVYFLNIEKNDGQYKTTKKIVL
jgi:hypothetical protein